MKEHGGGLSRHVHPESQGSLPIQHILSLLLFLFLILSWFLSLLLLLQWLGAR